MNHPPVARPGRLPWLAGMLVVAIAGFVPAPARAQTESELRDVVTRFTLDREALGRRWGLDYSEARRERLRSSG